MNSFNRVLIMGQLTETPILSTGRNGRPYTRLKVTTERTWVDVMGVSHRALDGHSVFVWGALAEFCGEVLRKDASVFVEGVLAYWREDGKTLVKSAIQAERVKVLDARAVDNPAPPRNPENVAHPA